MISRHNPHDVTHRLVDWAARREAVRAVLLTSSRAKPSGPVDALSDYDVVLVVTDIHPFFDDRTWLRDFGTPLVVYWDAIAPEPDYGVEQSGNVAQFVDGLKIDFRLWPVALARRIVRAPALPAGLEDGYTVLLDKDGVTTDLRPPSYRAYIPPRPSDETFQMHVQDFYSDAPYVAKCLWRDELLRGQLSICCHPIASATL